MKNINAFFLICLMLITSTTIAQDNSATFEILKETIQHVVPSEYKLNPDQTRDSRFGYQLTYDKDEMGSNRLIFRLSPDTKDFGETGLDYELFEYDGRKASFLDGSETGMSGIEIILKNEKGSIKITNRAFDSPAMNKTEFEEMLGKIDLNKLEDQ